MRVGCKDTLLLARREGPGHFVVTLKSPRGMAGQRGGRLRLVMVTDPLYGHTPPRRYLAIRMHAEAGRGVGGGVARRAATQATPPLRFVAGV
jgi:hypothetical protein